jgi:hypothetical protein
MLNAYFNNYAYAREQDILEDLILESIKIYGHDVKYLPRTRVATDHLFGEDPLSTFDEAINVEMYVKSVEGFEGDGQFLSKFGLEIRDQVVLTVARKRFDQAITSPKIMSEVGYNITFEDGDNDAPSRQNLSGSQATESWVQEGDDYTNTLNRPQEGDLIYIPVVEKIFEIQHVDYTPTFYQTGRLQTYDIRCEVFEYSSERINTGNTVIDAIETEYTLDTLGYQFTLEDASGVLQSEDGGTFLQEFQIETQDRQANNTFYTSTVAMDGIIDFSEQNPFGEIDRY